MNKSVIRSVILGLAAALSFSGAALAQKQADALEAHLVRNAEVFGRDGMPIGTIESVGLDGSVVIRETRVPKTIPKVLYTDAPGDTDTAPPPAGSVLKVVPSGLLSWTGYGLKADLTEAGVKNLQDPDED